MRKEFPSMEILRVRPGSVPEAGFTGTANLCQPHPFRNPRRNVTRMSSEPVSKALLSSLLSPPSSPLSPSLSPDKTRGCWTHRAPDLEEGKDRLCVQDALGEVEVISENPSSSSASESSGWFPCHHSPTHHYLHTLSHPSVRIQSQDLPLENLEWSGQCRLGPLGIRGLSTLPPLHSYLSLPQCCQVHCIDSGNQTS